MPTRKAMLSKRENWGIFLQNNTIRSLAVLLCVAVFSGLSIGLIWYLMDKIPSREIFIFVVVSWLIGMSIGIPPLLYKIGKVLKDWGEAERYEQFEKECDGLLSLKILEDLCSGIYNLTSNSTYPLEFYQKHYFWHKVFAHKLFENLDIETFFQILPKVELPELLPIAWNVMINKLVTEKGIFYVRETAEDWLHLIHVEGLRTSQNLDRFRQALYAMKGFPATLSGCLNFSVQNPVFDKVFDVKWLAPLVNAQTLERFPAKEYLTLSELDRKLYQQAFNTLNRCAQKRLTTDNMHIFLSAEAQTLLSKGEISFFDNMALKEALVWKLVQGNIGIIEHIG